MKKLEKRNLNDKQYFKTTRFGTCIQLQGQSHTSSSMAHKHINKHKRKKKAKKESMQIIISTIIYITF